MSLQSAAAFAGLPQLNNLLPVAGQRGQTVEVTFYGERLHDASGALFHTEGIAASALTNHEKDGSKRVHATFTIAPDAPLGEHQLRLVTETGVTEMVTFHVVDRPLVKEQRDEPTKNGKRFTQTTSFDSPQAIELGTIVVGRTEAEDVDYFAVDLKKGQPFVAEVVGMRLGRGFTDSTLAVLDTQGNEVAACDDTLQHKQDPVVSFIAPRDGRYVLTLRDSGYLGSTNNWYLLKVDEAIQPGLVYPLGGEPGQLVKLRMIGDAGGDFAQQVTLPAQPDNGYEVLAEYKGLRAMSGLPLRVNRLKNVIENPAAKNNSMNDVKATEAHAPPVAFNGIIEQRGDHDCFKFSMKKGQQATFRCFARSMGSPLDSVINVFNAADNKHIQGNDDQGGADSVLAFKAPQDGDYYVRVKDHRLRGGADYVYRLEVTLDQPALSTAITRYDRNRPQSRQAIALPQGNRTAALVTVQRTRVGGDLTPEIAGLPGGVSYKGHSSDEQGNLMPVVFEAKPDATVGAVLADIQAVSKPKGDSAEHIRGGFSQVTPLVMANPNRTEYYKSTLDTIPVAVTQAIPFKIDVIQPKAPLVHGGKKKLQVRLTRNEGYEEQVRLYMLYRPPGIGAPGRIDLNKTNTEGVYEIDANASTPSRGWPMVIIGNGNQKGGAVWASSQLFTVKVEEPFVKGTIDSAKCKQGQTTQLVVNLEHPRGWQGEGELKLLGLPAHVTAEPLKIKPGQETASFKVKVAENTPLRSYKSLMCELVIQVNGEPVIHRFGQGGRLRVDRPGKDNAQAKGK
ncbi:MAG: PPC domain-containing protein [Phycisphaeraceae bacterium]|nr:PPC domain-containing protein [Phycisphaeraceae bacterium]